jgi:type IV secretion system protein VirD4
MVSPRDTESFQRIGWRAHLKTLADVASAAVGVAVFLYATVIAITWIYNRATGNSTDWLPIAELAAGFGAAAILAGWFSNHAGKAAIGGRGPLAVYLRAAVFWAVVVNLLFVLPAVVYGEVDRAAILPVVVFVGVFGAFIGICKRGYERRAPILAYAFVAIMGGGFGGLLSMVWVTVVLHHDVSASSPEMTIANKIGFAIGATVALWGRLIMKPRRDGDKFSFIDYIADIARRTQLLASGLIPFLVGLIALSILYKYGNFDFSDFNSWSWFQWGYVIGLVLLVLYFGERFAVGFGKALYALSWSRSSDETHGGARWATASELRRGGLMPGKNGIYLGEFLDNGVAIDTVGYPGPVHLITVGPNRSGKGTGLIIPNLAKLRRSIFIIDPKGEAAAITAHARAKFGPVKIINPFNVLVDELPYLQSGGFNPLAALDPTHDNFTDDCVAIAQALIKEETGGNAAFFSGSAQDLVAALVMHEKIECGDRASLANVRKMLTEPYAEDAKGNPVGLAKTAIAMSNSEYGPLRSKAARFTVGAKSVQDIIQTANNETRLLDSPALQRDLSGEAINWDSMKEKITTVYLILPSDRLETHANFLRLVVTSALRTLLRSRPSATLPPVLFMLDEFAQLGYLAPIENAMGIAAGFGVQLWPFLQDLNQLHALYKDRWQTFLGARGVLTAFAPQDMFTAGELSKLCGNKTVIVESENVRADSNVPGGGRTPQGVPLIRPEELMRMPAGQMLCFAAPVKYPFMTEAPGYWRTRFGRGLDDNPYHQG